MKTYDVYGIGNALVDMEFAVEDHFLETMQLDKGVMTLVSAEQQALLLNALEDLPGTQAGGGSAANTLFALNHFGSSAFYTCKVAADNTGDFFLKDLNDAGIDTNLNDHRDSGTTGTCVVMVTPDAERTMNTYLGITEEVSPQEINEQALSKSNCVYLEGYLVTSKTGRAAAIKARELASEHDVKTALTFSDPNMVQFFRDGLQEMVGDGVDLLFCNEAEALGWAKTDNIESAVKALSKIAKAFAITLGAKGALIHDGQQTLTIPAHPVKALDTNGAGDMFAGAFLHALNQDYSFEHAGRLASFASAQVVSHFGARLPAEKHKPLLDTFILNTA